jgi:hypothetical protein
MGIFWKNHFILRSKRSEVRYLGKLRLRRWLMFHEKKYHQILNESIKKRPCENYLSQITNSNRVYFVKVPDW